MNKIKLKRNPNGDTRTAPKDITFEQFQKANKSHKKDVKNVMHELANDLELNGLCHDWTKNVCDEEFYRDFKNTLENGTDFTQSEWYQLHVHREKHHPMSYCHDDINLLDIIEMIVDCVCAGKTRAGEIRQMEINDEILKKAFHNTVDLVDDMTEVVEDEED